MLYSNVNLWTKPNSVCVSLCRFILVVAVHLRTALAACQPLILMFSRCVFAHGTGCVSAFDFNV